MKTHLLSPGSKNNTCHAPNWSKMWICCLSKWFYWPFGSLQQCKLQETTKIYVWNMGINGLWEVACHIRVSKMVANVTKMYIISTKKSSWYASMSDFLCFLNVTTNFANRDVQFAKILNVGTVYGMVALLNNHQAMFVNLTVIWLIIVPFYELLNSIFSSVYPLLGCMATS